MVYEHSHNHMHPLCARRLFSLVCLGAQTTVAHERHSRLAGPLNCLTVFAHAVSLGAAVMARLGLIMEVCVCVCVCVLQGTDTWFANAETVFNEVRTHTYTHKHTRRHACMMHESPPYHTLHATRYVRTATSSR